MAVLTNAVEQLIVAGKLPVPLLPQVATQLLQATNDESTDAGRVAALIHRDPALAGQVLRIANSPSYQPRMPIVSLQQAVARLGLSVMREIAVSASFQNGVFKVPGFEKELAWMWRHALGTAAFAKEVARLRRLNVENAFLCGLLHRVGEPVLLQVAVNDAKRSGLVAASPALRGAILDLAARLAGRAGESIGTAWKLPPPVLAAMVHHAAPEAAGPHVQEAALTSVAAALARHTLDESAAAEPPPLDHPGFALLNLYPNEAMGLLARADSVRRLVESLTG